MALVKNGDEKLDFETIQHAQHMNGDIEAKDVLVPVFQDGEILVDFTLGPDLSQSTIKEVLDVFK
jgi:hypothetical protein